MTDFNELVGHRVLIHVHYDLRLQVINLMMKPGSIAEVKVKKVSPSGKYVLLQYGMGWNEVEEWVPTQFITVLEVLT